MRVIAGKYGSRKIEAVKGMGTRPTTDKVKEAVFSKIGPYFDGGVMLDLFAGSGGMSLEALSRGMDKSVLVDNDGKAIMTIKANIQSLKVQEQCVVLKKNAFTALEMFDGNKEQFDLVFLDPPYAKQKIADILEILCYKNLLTNNAIVVCETDKEVSLPDEVEKLVCYKEAVYGISKISYFKIKECSEND